MRSRSVVFLALAMFTSVALAQDSTLPTWSLKSSTPFSDLVGEWELSMFSGGSNEREVAAAAASAQVKVTRGSSFQLRVKLVNPAGVETDVTGSSKLMYLPKGCMVVSEDGIATVLQSAMAPWTCAPGDSVPLTIIYVDKTSDVAAVNMYLFSID